MLMSKVRAKEGGFTLLEVLVAMVLLAIGLLGLAGLQATSMNNSHSAYLRTQATVLAYSIVDAMRANRCAAKAGEYDIAMSSNPPGTPTTLAQRDVSDWIDEAALRLPAGDGQVVRVTTPTGCDGDPTQITVTVQWSDERGVQGGSTHQFAMQTEI